MPQKCTVCTHPQRDEIEERLIRRDVYRAIACHYSIGRESLRRHQKQHLPELLKKAYDARETDRAGDLLEQAHHLQDRTLAILEHCEKVPGQYTVALQAIREARGNLELFRRIIETEQLDERLAEVEKLFAMEDN